MIPTTLIALYFFDQDLANFFGSPERNKIALFARDITDVALAEFYFALAFGVYLIAKFAQWIYKKNEALVVDRLLFFQRWSINFFVALVTSGILVHLFKNLIGRQRPHLTANFDAFVFSPFNFHWDWHSMPSGHSQVMFTAATMIAIAFPRLKIFWFAAAASIAFTRVMIQYHFLSDVVVGAWVGYVGAHLAMFLMRKSKYSIFQL